MTTTLPLPQTDAYRLGDRLAHGALVSAVHTPLPNEVAREELLLKKLGARGWGRMHHFRHYYQTGWGEARCKPLSPRASEAFFRFLEAVDFPPDCLPSLFLTDLGGLELRWESSGSDVQVEFASNAIEVYFAEQEWTVHHADAVGLARQLSSR